jgi:ABC-type glycerol-3-phosphate transport system permease component
MVEGSNYDLQFAALAWIINLHLCRGRGRHVTGMGACLIASLPIAVIYNFFVDRFVTGFTVGAVK